MILSTDPHVLILHPTDLIAMGQRSLVYRHREDENSLIKVVNPKFREKKSFKAWLFQQVPSINCYRLSKCCIRELIESVRLRFNENYTPASCIQQVNGLVDTNLGLGLIVKAEKGRDGNYAKTLKTIIQLNQFDDTVREKLETFYNDLAHCDVAVSDCVPRNIVYAYDEVLGDHFVLIDGIGENTLIPILRFSTYLRKKSRLRRIKLLKKRLAMSLAKYQNHMPQPTAL